MSKSALILLVEDEEMDVELTLDAFGQVGLDNQIHVSRTGEEAIEYLFGQSRSEDGTRFPVPDLILLDLKLPGIDGFEVLRRVKQAPRLRRIPVVILTSSREEGDRAMGYDSGANSYLVKPISFAGFLEVVRAIGEYWLTLNVGAPSGDAADD